MDHLQLFMRPFLYSAPITRSRSNSITSAGSCVNLQPAWVLINDAGDRSTSHSEHFTMLSWGLYSPWLTWHWLNIKRLCRSSAIFLMPDTDSRNRLFQLLVWALCRLTFICFRSFAEITCWICGVLCRSWCGSLSKWALARTASIITCSGTVAPF